MAEQKRKIVGYRLVVQPKSAISMYIHPDPAPMSPEKQKRACEELVRLMAQAGVLKEWYDHQVEPILEEE